MPPIPQTESSQDARRVADESHGTQPARADRAVTRINASLPVGERSDGDTRGQLLYTHEGIPKVDRDLSRMRLRDCGTLRL